MEAHLASHLLLSQHHSGNGPPWRANYGSGTANQGLKQTTRCVFNNAFVHHQLFGAKPKAFVVPPKRAEVRLQVDGNLFWSLEDGLAAGEDYFGNFRKSKTFQDSQQQYAPGWSAHDLVADPQFKRLSADMREPTDLALQQDSPTVNAGVAVPAEWPDSFRGKDRGEPDIGAIPLEIEPWGIGIHGKISVLP